jgi:hypothetical protein
MKLLIKMVNGIVNDAERSARLMRDPTRVPKVLIELGKLWSQYPDLRLGQFIINSIYPEDLYNIEDEMLLKVLEMYYVKNTNRRLTKKTKQTNKKKL